MQTEWAGLADLEAAAAHGIQQIRTAVHTMGGGTGEPDPCELSFEDWEQMAGEWGDRVPAAPEPAATAAYHFCQRYGPIPAWAVRTREALGVDRVEVIRSHELLFGCPPQVQRDAVWQPGRTAAERAVRAAERIIVRAGDWLVHVGEPSDYVWAVIAGKLAVLLQRGGRTVEAPGRIGAGELIGEIELCTGGVYRASIRAARDSELIRFPRSAVAAMAEADPRVWATVARTAVYHMERAIAEKRPSQGAVAIAIVPAGEGTRLDAFIPQFLESLRTLGATAVVTGESRNLMPAGPGGDTVPLHRLAEIDRSHAHVLFCCDGRATPWTRFAIRQADRILLVGESGLGSEPNATERRLLAERADQGPPQHLLLVHPEHGSRTPAQVWLAQRPHAEIHHATAGIRAELDRVARMVTGKAWGLTLGGGGARGFVHIGVIRALRECGFTIDATGGSSMGAYIGALCAMGADHKQMLECSMDAWIRRSRILDYTIPLVSLVSGRRLAAAFYSTFGERRIEDLASTFFAVSSDLISGDSVIHRDGPIRAALRASSSVPGITPPVPDRGRLLVDGGILNNLPTNVMSSILRPGKVIGVDANPYGYESLQCSPYGETLPARRILANVLNPFRRGFHVPNMQSILERSAMLVSISRNAESRDSIDFYLRPPTDQFSVMNSAGMAEMVEFGYRFAMIEIEGWKEAKEVSH